MKIDKSNRNKVADFFVSEGVAKWVDGEFALHVPGDPDDVFAILDIRQESEKGAKNSIGEVIERNLNIANLLLDVAEKYKKSEKRVIKENKVKKNADHTHRNIVSTTSFKEEFYELTKLYMAVHDNDYFEEEEENMEKLKKLTGALWGSREGMPPKMFRLLSPLVGVGEEDPQTYGQAARMVRAKLIKTIEVRSNLF